MARLPFSFQYWDSCMFISLLTGKDPTRVAVIKELCELEADESIRIVTSTFSRAEVRPHSGYADFDADQVKSVEAILNSGRVDWRPVTPFIAEEAMRIGQSHPDLLPADCVHIASAVAAKASVLFTFDGEGAKRRKPSKMLHWDDKIGTPPLRIHEPFVPKGPLFDPIQERVSG
jgi:predicted nucleic acid-binding protein